MHQRTAAGKRNNRLPPDFCIGTLELLKEVVSHCPHPFGWHMRQNAPVRGSMMSELEAAGDMHDLLLIILHEFLQARI
jgi:hypothetical protein